MSRQPPQPVSLVWEMVAATAVGVAAGMWSENIMIGSVAGIAIGVMLSIIKTLRTERRRKS